MKLRVLFLLVVMFIVFKDSDSAQTSYSPTLDLYMSSGSGGLWFDQSNAFLDSMMRNRMEQQQMQMLMFNQMVLDQMIKQEAGKRKIATGQATTRFVPSPQNSVAEQWSANGKTAQEKQEIKQTVTLAVQAFNDALKKKRMTPYDTADGNALAFILCYLAYHDEDPGAPRLAKTRDLFRTNILKNLLDQGTPDAEKQQMYERRAFQTMLAVRAYEQSKQQNISTQEKQTAEAAAKKYAEQVLKVMWPSVPAERIVLSNTTAWGFDDRGAAAIASGKATVTFTRGNTVLSATELAREYNISERKIESLINEFDSEVKRRGGATNDVAWMNALSFAICYNIYTDGRVNLNQSQFNWVMDAMRKDVMSFDDYQAFSNEGKQKYYERWAVVAMMLREQSRNPETQNKAKREAEERVALLLKGGIDSYALTATGFVKKK